MRKTALDFGTLGSARIWDSPATTVTFNGVELDLESLHYDALYMRTEFVIAMRTKAQRAAVEKAMGFAEQVAAGSQHVAPTKRARRAKARRAVGRKR